MNLELRTVPNGEKGQGGPEPPNLFAPPLWMVGPSFRSGSPAAAPPLTVHRREVVAVMISEDVAEVEVERRRPLQPRLRMEREREGERNLGRRRLLDCKKKEEN